MTNAWYLGSTLPLLKQTAKFAERRQDILAGNIANIDTPGYKMRDLSKADFQTAMRQAIAAEKPAFPRLANGEAGLSPGDAGLSLGVPAGMDGQALPATDPFQPDLFAAKEVSPQQGITFHDGNNRSVEHQFLEMSKNAVLQQFAIDVMSLQFNQLQTVISERL